MSLTGQVSDRAVSKEPQARRFNLVDSPQALPGHCFLCRFHDSDKWIDAGFSEEFFGAVYFCEGCLAEIAGLLGYMTPEQAEKIKADHDLIKAENGELTLRTMKLERLNAAFVDYLGDDARNIVGRSIAELLTASDNAETVSTSPGNGPQQQSGKNPGSPVSKQGTIKSGNEQGLGNVRPTNQSGGGATI